MNSYAQNPLHTFSSNFPVDGEAVNCCQLVGDNRLLPAPTCYRHREARLSLFSKAAGGHSAISLSHLSQPTRQTRRADHTSFIPISARTDVYKYSFFPRTLLDWSTLSAEVRLKYSLSASESADLVD